MPWERMQEARLTRARTRAAGTPAVAETEAPPELEPDFERLLDFEPVLEPEPALDWVAAPELALGLEPELAWLDAGDFEEPQAATATVRPRMIAVVRRRLTPNTMPRTVQKQPRSARGHDDDTK